MLKLFSKLFICSAFVLAFVGTAHTQQQQSQPGTAITTEAGRIVVVQVTGEVYVFTTGETLRFPVRNGSLILQSQSLATGPKASVMLAFSNGATITIGENALIAIDEFTQKPFGEMFKMAQASGEPSASTTRMNLVRGEIIANVKKLNKEENSSFEIKTPIGVAGIRGTTFRLSFIPIETNGATGAEPNITQADFSLIMLEGVIEMSVPNRPRPIVIPQGKQLVLENIDISAEDGAAVAMSESESEPSDAPATAQALLLQHVQNMLSATNDIAMPASTPSVNTPAQSRTQSDPSDPASNNQTNAQEGGQPSEQTNEAPSPAPGPQNPAPRLSPTDGTGQR